MIKKLGVFLTIGLALTALIITPGKLMGAEQEGDLETYHHHRNPVEVERYDDNEAAFEEKQEIHKERIEELKEEGVISEKVADELYTVLEERSSFKRGICHENGPRHSEINLELRKYFGDENGETRNKDYGHGRRGIGHGFHR